MFSLNSNSSFIFSLPAKAVDREKAKKKGKKSGKKKKKGSGKKGKKKKEKDLTPDR